MNPQVLIIGAGAAGLAALSYLTNAGMEAICVEARDRIGGRILTIHDPLSAMPIELGAEFIHGRPPEIWDMIREKALPVYDGTDTSLHLEQGLVDARDNSWELVGHILEDMQRAATNGPDISFQQFLDTTAYPDHAKRSARGYVEGFNAAKAEVIGIHSLTEETKAAELIDGDRNFRFFRGYDDIPLHLLGSNHSKVLLNNVVESVTWRRGAVSLHVRNEVSGLTRMLQAPRAIITVPLGVLQTGAIRFDPQPEAILDAARRLCFGHVFRVVFRFSAPFWESKSDLVDAGFLFSQQPVFPTWWTTLSARSCNITGWSAGAKAEPLMHESCESVISKALASLAIITGFSAETIRDQLQAAYFHDWHADPFSCGSYSYVPAGALRARKALAVPVQQTLYFAGEATDQEGHSATVHGAIASGHRAARQILMNE